MTLDESHWMNRRVLVHLRRSKDRQPIASPARHPDPYMQAGSHPDVVERLWDVLGSSLPVDCRALVYGTPALVDPVHGVVLALAYGTRYAIRVPDGDLGEALKAGCTTEQQWSDGEQTDIVERLGRGWLFGCWAEAEARWLRDLHAGLRSNV